METFTLMAGIAVLALLAATLVNTLWYRFKAARP